MQVPFACFAVIAIYRHFPDEKHNNQNKKINFVGLTLLGLSISTLFILSEILLKDVTITTKLVLTALIIIFISLYAFSYNKVKNPIIDLSIFLNKDFRISFMSNFFLSLNYILGIFCLACCFVSFKPSKYYIHIDYVSIFDVRDNCLKKYH